MDVLETERKRNIEASLLNAEQVCYTRSFNVGDLCLVATHKIGKKEDDTARPLLACSFRISAPSGWSRS